MIYRTSQLIVSFGKQFALFQGRNVLSRSTYAAELFVKLGGPQRMEMTNEKSSYDPEHGLRMHRQVSLSWKHWGNLIQFPPYKKEEEKSAGLYAYILGFSRYQGEKPTVLYIGKAGGLKPKSSDQWVNGILTRALGHWKSGPFRGLCETLAPIPQIHLWILDFRGELEKIGERDIERIENELLRFWKRENKGKLPPGNTSTEGGSKRNFQVSFQFIEDAPLPSVILRAGELEENRSPCRKKE